jgi:hypothetical protein
MENFFCSQMSFSTVNAATLPAATAPEREEGARRSIQDGKVCQLIIESSLRGIYGLFYISYESPRPRRTLASLAFVVHNLKFQGAFEKAGERSEKVNKRWEGSHGEKEGHPDWIDQISAQHQSPKRLPIRSKT